MYKQCYDYAKTKHMMMSDSIAIHLPTLHMITAMEYSIKSNAQHAKSTYHNNCHMRITLHEYPTISIGDRAIDGSNVAHVWAVTNDLKSIRFFANKYLFNEHRSSRQYIMSCKYRRTILGVLYYIAAILSYIIPFIKYVNDNYVNLAQRNDAGNTALDEALMRGHYEACTELIVHSPINYDWLPTLKILCAIICNPKPENDCKIRALQNIICKIHTKPYSALYDEQTRKAVECLQISIKNGESWSHVQHQSNRISKYIDDFLLSDSNKTPTVNQDAATAMTDVHAYRTAFILQRSAESALVI